MKNNTVTCLFGSKWGRSSHKNVIRLQTVTLRNNTAHTAALPGGQVTAADRCTRRSAAGGAQLCRSRRGSRGAGRLPCVPVLGSWVPAPSRSTEDTRAQKDGWQGARWHARWGHRVVRGPCELPRPCLLSRPGCSPGPARRGSPSTSAPGREPVFPIPWASGRMAFPIPDFTPLLEILLCASRAHPEIRILSPSTPKRPLSPVFQAHAGLAQVSAPLPQTCSWGSRVRQSQRWRRSLCPSTCSRGQSQHIF